MENDIHFIDNQGRDVRKSITIIGMTLEEVKEIAMEKARDCADCHMITIFRGRGKTYAMHSYSALGKLLVF
jgi:hypothetical protein